MTTYIKRALEKRLEEALKVHPVIVLTGPRQVGKSTLLENAAFLKDWRYLTLDDPDVLEQAKDDPKGLLHEETPTIIDEVQRHTPLFLTIKYLVDRSKGKRRFILSGSGNISLRKEPRESLAGRAEYLHLTPLGMSELYPKKSKHVIQTLLSGGTLTRSNLASLSMDDSQATWRGGLPRVFLTRSRKSSLEILKSYVDTYLQRDIQDLVKVRHPENFRRLMVELAKRTGWESRQEELSNLSGEERSNVSRHISLLKETGLLYEIRGYFIKGEKAYRQAKYYWFDSGTACFLSGIYSSKELGVKSLKGRYFENFVLQQILFFVSLQVMPPQIFYWKPKQEDLEIDFVLKQSDTVVPIEVKSSPRLTFHDTRAIRKFFKAHPETKRGILIYTGSQIYQIATNIYAVPWHVL